MKEILQEKLLEVITAVQNAAGKAGEFALTQLPQIAQEYVMYGRVKSAVLSGLLLLIGSVLICTAVWAYRNPWNNDNYTYNKHGRGESNQLVIGIGGLFGAVFVLTAFLAFDHLVWFAPKVWLLKELASLTR